MNKNKGVTLIELLVVLAIVGIIASVVFGNRSKTQCLGGYVFTNDYKHPTQVLDEKGAGIKCDAK